MSELGFKSLPGGVRLGPIVRAAFEALAQHTSFPWPIMQAQCKRESVDPEAMSAADLARVIPHFVTAIARFTNPEAGSQVESALRRIT